MILVLNYKTIQNLNVFKSLSVYHKDYQNIIDVHLISHCAVHPSTTPSRLDSAKVPLSLSIT